MGAVRIFVTFGDTLKLQFTCDRIFELVSFAHASFDRPNQYLPKWAKVLKFMVKIWMLPLMNLVQTTVLMITSLTH